MLVALCIKGLRSPDPYVVQLSLSRIQYYIFNETLAGWFEKDDGVVMLVSLLAHQAVLGDKGNPVIVAQIPQVENSLPVAAISETFVMHS